MYSWYSTRWFALYTKQFLIHQVSSFLHSKWTWSITWRYRLLWLQRLNTAGPLLAKADWQHESYHLISQMTDHSSGVKWCTHTMFIFQKNARRWPIYSVSRSAADFANIDGQDRNATATGLSSGINSVCFEVYGVESHLSQRLNLAHGLPSIKILKVSRSMHHQNCWQTQRWKMLEAKIALPEIFDGVRM